MYLGFGASRQEECLWVYREDKDKGRETKGRATGTALWFDCRSAWDSDLN